MKKIKSHFFILITILGLLTSCSNLFDLNNTGDSSASSDNGEVILSGSLELKGAVPQEFLTSKTGNAKYAAPASSNFSSGISYKITATNGTKTVTTTATTAAPDFSLLLSKGSWEISVIGTNSSNKAVLHGKYINDETENKITVDDSTLSLGDISISMQPYSDGTGTGDVNLYVYLDTDVVKSYKITWKEGDTDHVLSGNTLTLTQIIFCMIGSDQNYSVDADRYKTSGAYPVKFEFYGEEGCSKLIYTVNETVNIFNNCTTNTWNVTGDCSYITSGVFKIDSDVIKSKRHIYYVDSENGDDTNEGAYYSPKKSLQNVANNIIKSNDGDKYQIILKNDYNVTDVNADFSSQYSCLVIDNTSDKKLIIDLCSYKNNNYKINCQNKNARSILVKGSVKAISLNLSNITLTGANILGGGAIYQQKNTEVTLNSNTILCDNTVTKIGGAVVLSGSSTDDCKLTINDGAEIYSNIITDTSVNGQGGAIYVASGTVEMNGGSIGKTGKANSAGAGAGIYLSANKSQLTLNGGNIINNESVYYGGGICVAAGTVFLNGGYFKDNSSSLGNGMFISSDYAEAAISYTSKVILSDDILFDPSDTIYLENQKIYMNSELSETNVATLVLRNDNPEDVPAGTTPVVVTPGVTQVLANLNAGGTDYVKLNYDKFTITNAGYEIYDDGIVYEATPSIANIAAASGKTVSELTLSDLGGQKDFTLSSEEELRAISRWAQGSALYGYSFALSGPITMSSNDFTPIGTTSYKFQGSFDGGGKTISNLHVNVTQYAGLFGYCLYANVENLTVEGDVNCSGKYAALIIAYDQGNSANHAQLKNLTAKGTVNGGQYVGGIVGNCLQYCEVENCVNYASVTATDSAKTSWAGGICGYAKTTSISNCVNFGHVVAQNSYAGGIIASADTGTPLVSLTSCVNLGSVDGYNTLVGGIAGDCSKMSLKDSYNAGDVSITTGLSSVGFVSGISSDQGDFTNVYYTNTSASIFGLQSGDGGKVSNKTVNELESITPFSAWTDKVIVNGVNYPVPVSCEPPVSLTMIGDFLQGGAEKYQIGDIIFNDGSFTHYSSSMVYTTLQKNSAVGVVFCTKYNSSTGNSTNGSTVLMVGLHNTNDSSEELVDTRWALDSVNGYNLPFSTSNCDGSGNWAVIKNADNAGANNNGYPAFDWVNGYAAKFSTGAIYTNWYMPAIYELHALNQTVGTVNTILEKLCINPNDYYLTNNPAYASSTQAVDGFNSITMADYKKFFEDYTFDSTKSFSEQANVLDKNTADFVLAIHKLN